MQHSNLNESLLLRIIPTQNLSSITLMNQSAIMYHNLTNSTNLNINSNSTILSPETDPDANTGSKFLTLCMFWLLIVIGNSLVIAVHRIHRRKHIPDYLILILAGIDILNAVGPVAISLIMYRIHPSGFVGISNDGLCKFYNTAATMLRLSACFIMTMIALDRATSVEVPMYYRMILRLKTVKRWTGLLITVACILACLPLAGVAKVFPFRTVCSFDFGSEYAVLIAVLGYVQLLIVLVCYVLVVKGLVGFVGRQAARRRDTTVRETNKSFRQKLADRRKSSSGQVMKDIYNFKIGKHFAKMTGLISILFYVSWMPIVFSITVRLVTGKYSAGLQFYSARMSLIGSIGNPIVYGVMSSKYRKGYWYCLRMIASLCGASKPTHPAKKSARK